MIKLSTLKPLEKNPFKSKGDEQIKAIGKSIQDFEKMMAVRQIVYDEVMTILGGNKRYFALKMLGYKEIPDEWVKQVTGWTEAEKREFIVKDNAHWGSTWDIELLNEWDVPLEEWGLDLPVWDEPEAEAQEDDYDVPEGGIETDIVIGDLFEIGEHRLLCGDSTQTDAYNKLMQIEQADMVITDPPYNVAYEGKTKDKLKMNNDSMGNDDFYQFLYDFYSALTTAVKKGGAIYIWHASSEIINFGKAMVDAGWLLKQQLIWVKNTMVIGRQDYHWKHEPCLYGWLAGGSHNWYSDRKQTTVINFDKPQRNGEHPTMKPIGLFAYQIGNSSKIGDIIIDAFGGSGTTMVACEQMNRKARVIELDPKYCQVIIDRMIELDPKYCQVIIDRMIKLDPTLIIKKNGADYVRQNKDI